MTSSPVCDRTHEGPVRFALSTRRPIRAQVSPPRGICLLRGWWVCSLKANDPLQPDRLDDASSVGEATPELAYMREGAALRGRSVNHKYSAFGSGSTRTPPEVRSLFATTSTPSRWQSAGVHAQLSGATGRELGYTPSASLREGLAAMIYGTAMGIAEGWLAERGGSGGAGAGDRRSS